MVTRDTVIKFKWFREGQKNKATKTTVQSSLMLLSVWCTNIVKWWKADVTFYALSCMNSCQSLCLWQSCKIQRHWWNKERKSSEEEFISRPTCSPQASIWQYLHQCTCHQKWWARCPRQLLDHKEDGVDFRDVGLWLSVWLRVWKRAGLCFLFCFFCRSSGDVRGSASHSRLMSRHPQEVRGPGVSVSNVATWIQWQGDVITLCCMNKMNWEGQREGGRRNRKLLPLQWQLTRRDGGPLMVRPVCIFVMSNWGSEDHLFMNP